MNWVDYAMNKIESSCARVSYADGKEKVRKIAHGRGFM